MVWHEASQNQMELKPRELVKEQKTKQSVIEKICLSL